MMGKIVVDAPDLKAGEKYSSGGVRKNGKMVFQYKNPRPYVEKRVVINEPVDVATIRPKEVYKSNDLIQEIGEEVIDLLWDNIGRPLLDAVFKRMGEYFISGLETRKTSKDKLDNISSDNSKKTYVKEKDSSNVNSDRKIIDFNSRKAS